MLNLMTKLNVEMRSLDTKEFVRDAAISAVDEG
jgi:hypothetical protein